MTDVNLEDLPMHELKRACKERGLKQKATDKKADLIKMLRSGESTHKPREAKRMAHLETKKAKKSVPMLPVEIKEQLQALAQRGLTWTINETDCCVTFSRDIKTCANLDQSANNILRTAQQAFKGMMSAGFSIEAGNEVQARSLDGR